MPSHDDATLLDRARSGDRRALDALLARIEPSVHKFGLKLCRDDETAEEVLQETLLAAVRHLSTFRGDSALSTWLYTIAKSVCIKQRRRSKFAPVALEPLEATQDALAAVAAGGARVAGAVDRPDHSLERAELGEHLGKAIAALEPMYRDVLLLRDVEGLTAAEVAETLGLTVDAVKSRLHRARASIREKLEPFLGVVAPAAPGCPDVVALLSAHLEGEMTSNTCKQMEQHLAGCPRCAAQCDSLRATLRVCQTAGSSGSVPAEVRTSVEGAVRRFLYAHDAGLLEK
jgi:RNA polymerase sigma-70 factor, ECF subfamily